MEITTKTIFYQIFFDSYIKLQVIKFVFLFALLTVMIAGATNLVSKITKGVFEASARQPEKADFFSQKALVFIGFGDVFIGLAAAAVLPIMFKDPVVDVAAALEQAESSYQRHTNYAAAAINQQERVSGIEKAKESRE